MNIKRGFNLAIWYLPGWMHRFIAWISGYKIVGIRLRSNDKPGKIINAFWRKER